MKKKTEDKIDVLELLDITESPKSALLERKCIEQK